MNKQFGSKHSGLLLLAYKKLNICRSITGVKDILFIEQYMKTINRIRLQCSLNTFNTLFHYVSGFVYAHDQ
jgi:hypothetical protein